MSNTRNGALMALLAYVLWGFFPIYWKWLDAVPPFEVLAHRILWSLFFVVGLLAMSGKIRSTWAHLRKGTTRKAMVASTLLIATNWGLFIWAVSADRIRDASLGYYINPLLNVVIGRVVLGERLRPLQTVAVLLATTGVTWLAIAQGSLPWVSLVLALTFCLYGLVRKQVAVTAVEGLAIETLLTTPFVLVYLLCLDPPLGHLTQADGTTVALLLGSGVVTAVPLLAFAGAARRLRFGTLGMLQYLAPSLQLGCAVLIYDEPFGPDQAVTFGLIWAAVLLYGADSLRHGAPPRVPRSKAQR